jgi:hypothetical protein
MWSDLTMKRTFRSVWYLASPKGWGWLCLGSRYFSQTLGQSPKSKGTIVTGVGSHSAFGHSKFHDGLERAHGQYHAGSSHSVLGTEKTSETMAKVRPISRKWPDSSPQNTRNCIWRVKRLCISSRQTMKKLCCLWLKWVRRWTLILAKSPTDDKRMRANRKS